MDQRFAIEGCRLPAWIQSNAGRLGQGCPGSGPDPERPRNAVLIVIDTLRRDHLGTYGYGRNTSPQLDRLADESVRYTQARSQAPWTTPSVASRARASL